MPKNKTHSGAKKRFRITGTGKVKRGQAGKRTTLSTSRPPSPAGDRRGRGGSADTKKVKRMLGK